ncbi:MAG: hypothetical protein CMH54_10695 [Myxococcales bacterium]|nr:hypothetical protein [Myxococcales bacterium]
MKLVWKGTLQKMGVEATAPVRYTLRDGFHDAAQHAPDQSVNPLIGQAISLHFIGAIQCVACGRKTKKTFNQGYCFPCSQRRADADICIVKPELCHYFEVDNPCRDEDFAHNQCFQPHILYVSLTSGFKVGITRKSNVPSRWIDQGAVKAMPLAELPSRRDVGLVEFELAKNFQDRTHWMAMLKQESPEGDIEATAADLLERLQAMGVQGILPAEERVVHTFQYPVEKYPEKVKSLNLDKTETVSGTLQGIKGQYLILDTGVINLRKYTGYQVELQTA